MLYPRLGSADLADTPWFTGQTARNVRAEEGPGRTGLPRANREVARWSRRERDRPLPLLRLSTDGGGRA